MTQDIKDIRPCDVCRRERNVFVRCCGFGPMSLAYCEECLNKCAEPEWGYAYLLDEIADGIPSALNRSMIPPFTWNDGEYLSWDDWLKKRSLASTDP